MKILSCLMFLVVLCFVVMLAGCGDEGNQQSFLPLSDEQSPELSLAANALASPLAEKVLRSTVFIAAYTSRGRQIGSGFVCADETIATALHIVESETPIQVLVQDLNSGEFYIATETIASDSDNDIILFDVDGLPAPALSIGDSNACYIGQSIFVAGNPKGLKGTFSTGIISSIREETIGAFIINGKSLQITAPVSAGSSGSPVVTELGSVIGMVSSAHTDANDATFVIPSNILKTLLDSIPSPTSPIQR